MAVTVDWMRFIGVRDDTVLVRVLGINIQLHWSFFLFFFVAAMKTHCERSEVDLRFSTFTLASFYPHVIMAF